MNEARILILLSNGIFSSFSFRRSRLSRIVVGAAPPCRVVIFACRSFGLFYRQSPRVALGLPYTNYGRLNECTLHLFPPIHFSTCAVAEFSQRPLDTFSKG